LYALVFANGELNDGPAVRAALDAPKPWLVIAADGGLRHALALDLIPDLVIGDLDSADPAMLAHAQKQGATVQAFPAGKDETDLELALIAAAQRDGGPIRIVGAVGDRLDQTLGNITLLALPPLRGHDVRLVSGKQTTWLAYPGQTVIAGQPGDTLSLIPVEAEATGIITENLAYPLRHETLAFGPARGMSNVLLASDARVTFESGLLLMIHTQGRA
jgi:thiamine pyrophosphokinase